MNQLAQVLSEFQIGNQMNRVLGVFDLMEICEEEIARAKELYPDRQTEINEAFGLCNAGKVPAMQNKPPLFRLHCRQICEWIGLGAETQFGSVDKAITDAEVIVALSSASMGFPLSQSSTSLYANLFKKHRDVLDPRHTVDFPEARFDYDGEEQELYTTVVRACQSVRARAK